MPPKQSKEAALKTAVWTMQQAIVNGESNETVDRLAQAVKELMPDAR